MPFYTLKIILYIIKKIKYCSKPFFYLSGNEYIKVWIINQKLFYNPKSKKRHQTKEKTIIERYIPGFFRHFRICHTHGPKGCVTCRTQLIFLSFALQVDYFFTNICEISIDFSTFEVRFIINWRQIKTKLMFAWFIKSFISYKTCILPFYLCYMIYWKEQYFETVHKYDTYLKKMCRFSLKSKTKSYVKRTYLM